MPKESGDNSKEQLKTLRDNMSATLSEDKDRVDNCLRE